MRPLVKYHIIYLNRDRYSISAMCRFFEVSRSGYYNFVHRLCMKAHDHELAELIRVQQKKCDHTYGYRRMWKWLNKAKKIHKNPKTILRIMKKYELLSDIRRPRKWRQMGKTGASLRKLIEPSIQGSPPEPEMGNGYILYSHRPGDPLLVYDP